MKFYAESESEIIFEKKNFHFYAFKDRTKQNAHLSSLIHMDPPICLFKNIQV
jgi:hypothetical protein